MQVSEPVCVCVCSLSLHIPTFLPQPCSPRVGWGWGGQVLHPGRDLSSIAVDRVTVPWVMCDTSS